MQRWIIALALVALCHHPLLAQTDPSAQKNPAAKQDLTATGDWAVAPLHGPPTAGPAGAGPVRVQPTGVRPATFGTANAAANIAAEKTPTLALAQYQDDDSIQIDVVSAPSGSTEITPPPPQSQPKQYEVHVPYVFKREQHYTVQVPYEEEITDDDGQKITVTRTRTENRKRIIPVTRMRTETRTQTAAFQSPSTKPFGKTPDAGKPDARKPDAKKHFTLDANEVKFFSPRGDAVSELVATRQLRLRQPIVLLEPNQTLTPFFQQLIRPNTLLIQTQ